MSYFKFVRKRKSWKAFLEKELNKDFVDYGVIEQIEEVLAQKKYKNFTEDYLLNFEHPTEVLLKTINSPKRRTVYVHFDNYRLILKLTSFYMLRHYNNKFCSNSIAYVEGKSVKSAFRLIDNYNIKLDDILYKADFSDYFNAININILNGLLEDFLTNDDQLYTFIMKLLRDPIVYSRGRLKHKEDKGVMAGSPIAGILANIYMHTVDEQMKKEKHKYIRYADDVLIVGKDSFDRFNELITKLEVSLNPNKTEITTLKEGITFLGFERKEKVIDISNKALEKMKSRMKRRARWYRRWADIKGIDPDVAVKDYIKKINFKLFSDQDDSINWSRWYLPNINTTKSIQYLDKYFVTCIRYLHSGTWSRGKNHYNLKYKKIKALGFKSLVNEYYKIRKTKNSKKESI